MKTICYQAHYIESIGYNLTSLPTTPIRRISPSRRTPLSPKDIFNQSSPTRTTSLGKKREDGKEAFAKPSQSSMVALQQRKQELHRKKIGKLGKPPHSTPGRPQQPKMSTTHATPLLPTLVKPNPAAFHSTGALLKKKERKGSVESSLLHSNATLVTPETPSKRGWQGLPFSSPITLSMRSHHLPPTDIHSLMIEALPLYQPESSAMKRHKTQHEELFLETPSKQTAMGSSSLSFESPQPFDPMDSSFKSPHPIHTTTSPTHRLGSTNLVGSSHLMGPHTLFSPLRGSAWLVNDRAAPEEDGDQTMNESLLFGPSPNGPDAIRSSSSLLELLHRCSSPSTNGDHPQDIMMGSGALMTSEISMMVEDEEEDAKSSNRSIQLPFDLDDTSTEDTTHSLPPPPSIIWNTPFVHFLDAAYFQRVHDSKQYGRIERG